MSCINIVDMSLMCCAIELFADVIKRINCRPEWMQPNIVIGRVMIMPSDRAQGLAGRYSTEKACTALTFLAGYWCSCVPEYTRLSACFDEQITSLNLIACAVSVRQEWAAQGRGGGQSV